MRLKSPASQLFTQPFFRRRWKKTSKLCVAGLCEGNSLVTGVFPAQRASNAENVFIWWRHHDLNQMNSVRWHGIRIVYDKHVIYFVHRHYNYLTDHDVKQWYWHLTSRITFSNINYVTYCFIDNRPLYPRPPIYEYTSENKSLSRVTQI